MENKFRQDLMKARKLEELEEKQKEKDNKKA
jgi:hypothetical protein